MLTAWRNGIDEMEPDIALLTKQLAESRQGLIDNGSVEEDLEITMNGFIKNL